MSNLLSLREVAQSAMDQKTKPVGALGRLEALAIELCVQQGSLQPETDPARCLLFAGDHGISAFGVSLYPRSVTAQMMRNFISGGAAASVLAQEHACQLLVIDVGVDADLHELEGIVHEKVARGTEALHLRSAMSAAQCQQAMAVGERHALLARQAGVRVLLLGEMGIGNTTSAAVLLAALTQTSARDCVGSGTGVQGAQLEHKCALAAQALARPHQPDPQSLLQEFGGLEIAAMVGAILALRESRMSILIDGYIVTVAALIAVRMQPACRNRLLFAHRSAESAHGLALQALSAAPLLDWQLRLGEGSGALLVLPLLRSAAAIMQRMASFAEAGVSSA